MKDKVLTRQAFRGYDAAITFKLMEAGGCHEEFAAAAQWCEDASHATEDKSDFYISTCVRKTAALRKCMVANEAFFKFYIRDLDRGIDDNERRGYGIESEAYGGDIPVSKWRWWCNMRRK